MWNNRKAKMMYSVINSSLASHTPPPQFIYRTCKCTVRYCTGDTMLPRGRQACTVQYTHITFNFNLVKIRVKILNKKSMLYWLKVSKHSS